MFNNNCARGDGNCDLCEMWDEAAEVCMQDEDLGGTGKSYIPVSYVIIFLLQPIP